MKFNKHPRFIPTVLILLMLIQGGGHSARYPFSMLAPQSRQTLFWDWIEQIDTFDLQRKRTLLNEPVHYSNRIDKQIRNTIHQTGQLIRNRKLYEQEEKYLRRVLRWLESYYRNKNITIVKGESFNWKEYYLGHAASGQIYLAQSFFLRNSLLAPYLPIFLLGLAAKAHYLKSAKEKRPPNWVDPLSGLLLKLFPWADKIETVLWRWRLEERLAVIQKGIKKRRKWKKWVPDPNKFEISLRDKETLALRILNDEETTFGLSEIAEEFTSLFKRNIRFLFMGFSEEFRNELIAHPKFSILLWHILCSPNRPTHLVFHIPKYNRINIKKILEKIAETGNPPKDSHKLLMALKSEEEEFGISKVTHLIRLFRMIYAFNKNLPQEKKVKVAVINENIKNKSAAYTLFSQAINAAVKTAPNARVLFITTQYNARPSSPFYQLFRQLYSREQLHSIVLSHFYHLFRIESQADLSSSMLFTDFYIENLQPYISNEFDSLVCFHHPEGTDGWDNDNDRRDPGGNEPPGGGIFIDPKMDEETKEDAFIALLTITAEEYFGIEESL